jgi:hypothetical protein
MAKPVHDPLHDRLFEEFLALVSIHDRYQVRRSEALKVAEEADELLKPVIEEIHSFQAVGMRMGIDLFGRLETHVRDNEIEGEASTPTPALRVAKPSTAFSTKDFVLAEARRVYPAPVRAGALREQVKKLGHDIHEKTIGMSLYRWSKRGLMRRHGLDWFFVPEFERSAQRGAEQLTLQEVENEFG